MLGKPGSRLLSSWRLGFAIMIEEGRAMAGGMKMYGKHRFPGRLFIVEGIDGSGKSTQLSLLQKWLEAEGYAVSVAEDGAAGSSFVSHG